MNIEILTFIVIHNKILPMRLEELLNKIDNLVDEANKIGHKEPTAMHLATVNNEGITHGRIVLYKGIKDNNIMFVTNYHSQKANDMKENENIALTFYWELLKKQIRVNGIAKKASAEISDEYFAQRSFQSQVGAIISKQSNKLESHDEFMKKVQNYAKEHEEQKEGQKLKRPDNWGAYLVTPKEIEFWHEYDFRLHKRELYSISEDGNWNKEFLYP